MAGKAPTLAGLGRNRFPGNRLTKWDSGVETIMLEKIEGDPRKRVGRNGASEGIRTLAEKFLVFIKYSELSLMKTSLTDIPRQKAVKSTFNVAKCSQEFEARGVGISAERAAALHIL